MQEKENIEQLFKDAFSNYEESVRPELWTKISQSIQVPAPQITDPSTIVNSTISTGSGIFGSAAVWVAGAAFIVLSGLGIYYVATQNSNTQTGAEKTISQEDNGNNNSNLDLPKAIEKENNQNSDSKINPTPAFNNSEKSPNERTSGASEKVVLEPQVLSPNSTVNPDNTHTTLKNQEPADSQNPTHSVKSSESDVAKSTVAGKPDAIVTNFKAYPTSGTAPLTVDFNYNGQARKTEWQFGDGQTSSQINLVQHTFEKPGNYTVSLKFYDDQGQVTLLNQTIIVMENLQITSIPNIFTPNNDGRNDVFSFETSNLTELEVSIYDKSGKFVNKWTGLDGGWDGKLNSGDAAPEGTYFYIIFATGESFQKHQQKGTITLKR